MFFILFLLNVFILNELIGHENEHIIAISLGLAGFLITSVFGNTGLSVFSLTRTKYIEALKIAVFTSTFPLKESRFVIKTEPLFFILPQIVYFFLN